ncbi:unnamed protein product [Schistosoma curassoni]|uniref:Secreted protein n=1 Tax=Schistosoma curassoni TaxID=6186 RepID=A0A183KLX5_9TREM|nr:unnamed protein product [Schistosoma curassoni]
MSSILSPMIIMSSTYRLYRPIFRIESPTKFSTYPMNTSASNGSRGLPISAPSICLKCSPSNVNFTLSVHNNNNNNNNNNNKS